MAAAFRYDEQGRTRRAQCYRVSMLAFSRRMPERSATTQRPGESGAKESCTGRVRGAMAYPWRYEQHRDMCGHAAAWQHERGGGGGKRSAMSASVNHGPPAR